MQNQLNRNLVFNETNNSPFSGAGTCYSYLIGRAIEKLSRHKYILKH